MPICPSPHGQSRTYSNNARRLDALAAKVIAKPRAAPRTALRLAIRRTVGGKSCRWFPSPPGRFWGRRPRPQTRRPSRRCATATDHEMNAVRSGGRAPGRHLDDVKARHVSLSVQRVRQMPEDARLGSTRASARSRRRAGSNGGRRPGANGVRSTCRATPSRISSLIASPVAGALSMPQTL
jgi:hypothetical protein